MHDDFDQRFELMLRGFADKAPPGPSSASVSARLAQRTMWRLVCCAALLAILAVASATAVWQMRDSATPAEHAPVVKPDSKAPAPVSNPGLPLPVPTPTPERPEVAKPRVAPLGREADHVEMAEALTDFFAACGADRALIMKDGATQLSFSLNTRDRESLAQIRADIETLLANYDRAEITLRNGRLSYSLLASGRP